jgi:subfamily B ATP-binding cassette protein MsbA
LSTIKNADRIIVIKDGELIEQGSHDELMQLENGEYKHLYEMQFKNQDDENSSLEH